MKTFLTKSLGIASLLSIAILSSCNNHQLKKPKQVNVIAKKETFTLRNVSMIKLPFTFFNHLHF